MAKTEDLSGKRFFNLLVIERDYTLKTRNANWKCLCDCGNETIVASCKLRHGSTKSCGCYGRSIKTRHGMNRTPEYHCWEAIIQRCLNSKNTNYNNYGGRGIGVCGEWENSFQAFIKDMGCRPSPKHSIERIDNNKGYFPSNCKWATRKEQQRNNRNCVGVLDLESGIFYGSIAEACEASNLDYEFFRYALRAKKTKRFIRI